MKYLPKKLVNSFTFMVVLLVPHSSSSFTLLHSNSLPSFSPARTTSASISRSKTTYLSMIQRRTSRSPSMPSYRDDRSKRQERVGQIVRAEIASIIQLGYPIKNQFNELDDELRRRINVVNADVSPDLRQARITVSVIKRNKISDEEEYYDEDEDDEEEEDEDDDGEYDEDEEDFDDEDDYDEEYEIFPDSRSGDSVVDRRRAYSWLVRNTKQVRHALSQRLSHMKTIPNLTFVLADVGAAVDVMNLIDKVSKGNYKRDDIGLFGGDNDNLPAGMYLESELEEDDDYEWIDDEDEDEEDDWVDEDEEDKEEKSTKAKTKK